MSGVDNIFNIPEQKTIPKIVRIAASTVIEIIEVKMEVLRWDKLLNLGLFPKEVYKKEVEAYKAKMCRYGVPLDCRSDYAKTDWQAWTTVMTEDSEYTETVYRKIYDYINETVDRAPVSDWYSAERGRQYVFQNRSVLGALFINIM